MFRAAPVAGLGAGVGFVDYYEFRAGTEEVVAAALGLYEVRGDDDVGVDVEDGLVQASGAFPFEAADGAGQDLDGVDVELVAQFRLPLGGELGWAEDGQAGGLAAIEKLAGY